MLNSKMFPQHRNEFSSCRCRCCKSHPTHQSTLAYLTLFPPGNPNRAARDPYKVHFNTRRRCRSRTRLLRAGGLQSGRNSCRLRSVLLLRSESHAQREPGRRDQLDSEESRLFEGHPCDARLQPHRRTSNIEHETKNDARFVRECCPRQISAWYQVPAR